MSMENDALRFADRETQFENVAKAAEAAVELEEAAQWKENTGRYIHEFSKPVEWEGKRYEKLTFLWDTLTGADHMDIEAELLMRGKTLVIPEYTGGYLLGMAVRACAELKEADMRMRADFLKKLPLGDFMQISKKARSFLLRTGR